MSSKRCREAQPTLNTQPGPGGGEVSVSVALLEGFAPMSPRTVPLAEFTRLRTKFGRNRLGFVEIWADWNANRAKLRPWRVAHGNRRSTPPCCAQPRGTSDLLTLWQVVLKVGEGAQQRGVAACALLCTGPERAPFLLRSWMPPAKAEERHGPRIGLLEVAELRAGPCFARTSRSRNSPGRGVMLAAKLLVCARAHTSSEMH